MKKATGTSVLLVCVAVAATGVVVSSGMADAATESSAVATSTSTHPDLAATDRVDRQRSVSRSDRRRSTRAAENLSLSQESGGQSTRTEDLITREPRTVARAMLPEFGFSDSEFGCLDALYVSESDWDPRADNPTSSAYGIPQALTGGTHHNLPSDYMTNPVSQIRWGLDYIRSSYGTPCSAWSFKQSNGWY
ncbi:MAG: lytic transglycosylase domain-containing protein [Nocardioides sp.]